MVTTTETTTPTALHSTGGWGRGCASQVLNAARAAVTARDTINRNPTATTRPNERMRSSRNVFRLHPGFGPDPPVPVQRSLELQKRAGGGDDEGDAADHGREHARLLLAGALEQTLHGARALASNQVIELSHELAADGLGAENHTCDRGCDEEEARSQRACRRRARPPGAVRHRPTRPESSPNIPRTDGTCMAFVPPGLRRRGVPEYPARATDAAAHSERVFVPLSPQWRVGTMDDTSNTLTPWVMFAGCVLVIVVLYWAQAVLVPIALAVLLTFVLTPPVSWLERWVGRVPAVLVVVTLVFRCWVSPGGGSRDRWITWPTTCPATA